VEGFEVVGGVAVPIEGFERGVELPKGLFVIGEGGDELFGRDFEGFDVNGYAEPFIFFADDYP
jgi:hypothetical protein